jgi:hypothetical protein
MAQTKQQRELILLGVLVLIAAVVWYVRYGPSGKSGSGLSAGGQYVPIKVEDYGRILISLGTTQKTEYKSNGRNIFVVGPMPVEQTQAAAAPVKPPFKNYGPFPPAPIVIPPAVLDMVFFGYGMVPMGGARQAFLKEKSGDDVHIVSEGDLLLNHIRITHIGNERLDFEDINTGGKGSAQLEVPPAT